jgi:hypothetical protein
MHNTKLLHHQYLKNGLAAASLLLFASSAWPWINVLRQAPLSMPTAAAPSLMIASRNPSSWHWFGESVTVNNIIASTLPIQLQGSSIAATQPQDSMALLSINGQTPQVYRIGATLFPETQLIQITAHNIIINHAGQKERVSLPKNTL